MIKASEIFTSASILLNDEDFVRWPLTERAKWLNEAVEAILIAKPDASSKSVVLSLDEGTLQKVSIEGDQKPYRLLSITRNVTLKEDETRVGGRVIRPTTAAILDANEPNWHSKSAVPFKRDVRQYVFDDVNPLEFFVYPGNDGTGLVEAVVSFIPDVITVVATGEDEDPADPENIESWEVDIPLPRPYSVPLLDYLLYRCQAKDDTSGNAGRAMSHYNQFAAALGLKVQSEQATSPNARPK